MSLYKLTSADVFILQILNHVIIIIKMFKSSFIIRLFFGFVLSGLILVQELSAQVTPVNKIPEFTFSTLNGQSFTRNELKKNKKLVIVFFDITCDHCQIELAAIGDHINEFKNAEFYLVSLNQVAGIRTFMSTYGRKLNGRSNVTVLRDFQNQFITRFTPVQYPALYVFGQDFRLIKYFGQNSNVKEIISTVNKI